MMQEKKAINTEIGQHIKQERLAAGLTQERFSELIGIGVKHLSAIERGAVGLSLTTLKKICTVLAISSDVVLFGRSEKNDVSDLAARLELLSPQQYKVAADMMCKLLEAFAIDG